MTAQVAVAHRLPHPTRCRLPTGTDSARSDASSGVGIGADSPVATSALLHVRYSPTMFAIVLAAGEGKRMGSSRAKVLHSFAGRPLVTYPLAAAVEAGATHVRVVTGFDEAAVRRAVSSWAEAEAPAIEVAFVHQSERRGTGHAVECALPSLPREGQAWILSGDVPLVHVRSLARLRDATQRGPGGFAFATFRPANPHGYGRVLRDAAGRVVAIREERDATPVERRIDECNAGIYCIGLRELHVGIPSLGQDNAQHEKYLTDLVAWAATKGEVVGELIDPLEAEGVNTPEQLVALERVWIERQHAAG